LAWRAAGCSRVLILETVRTVFALALLNKGRIEVLDTIAQADHVEHDAS
jgi:hypothetical protein